MKELLESKTFAVFDSERAWQRPVLEPYIIWRRRGGWSLILGNLLRLTACLLSEAGIH